MREFDDPAFPCPEDNSWTRNHGMTLRDYFAAKMIPVLLIKETGEFSDPKWMAREAYKRADAMLRQRAEK